MQKIKQQKVEIRDLKGSRIQSGVSSLQASQTFHDLKNSVKKGGRYNKIPSFQEDPPPKQGNLIQMMQEQIKEEEEKKKGLGRASGLHQKQKTFKLPHQQLQQPLHRATSSYGNYQEVPLSA